MAPEQDFMPIEGWDHIELWVGNAKQAAHFYETAFGFTPVAYAGPETGVRDRASYVLDQSHIRLVVTSGLRADSEIARYAHAHGDGVKDVALTVPDAVEAYRQAIQRGGVSVHEPSSVEDDDGRVSHGHDRRRTARPCTRSSTGRSTRARISRATSRSRATARREATSACGRSTTSSATSSSAA